jgi:hypothetical protein
MEERGFAWPRVLIALAILALLVILANQVWSGSKTPLRTIRIGPDIVVNCKARESVVFTGFTLDGTEGPTPFLRGYLGPEKGTTEVEHGPPPGVSLRLRFAINRDESMMKVGAVSLPAPSPDAEEIPFRDDVLEYVHTNGKVELNVDVEAGRLVIQVRRPG